jgi:hypothetical protein
MPVPASCFVSQEVPPSGSSRVSTAGTVHFTANRCILNSFPTQEPSATLQRPSPQCRVAPFSADAEGGVVLWGEEPTPRAVLHASYSFRDKRGHRRRISRW